MQDEEKKSPYHGLIFISLTLIIIPIVLSIFIYFIIKQMDEFMPQVGIEYQAIAFGFGLGFITDISFFIFGVFDMAIKAVKTRLKNFFYNASISHKLARKWYLDDIKEYGIALWIYVIIVIIVLLICIYGLMMFLKIYLN